MTPPEERAVNEPAEPPAEAGPGESAAEPPAEPQNAEPHNAEPHNAASTLFDLRIVIAMLFGVYGVILTVLGLIQNDPAHLVKSAGINLNLWTGLAMLVFAALMATWQRLRPTN